MRTNAKLRWVASSLAVLNAAALLQADEIADPAKYDRNGDNKLSENELIQYVIARDKLRPDVAKYLDSNFQFIPTNDGPRTLEDAVKESLSKQAGFLVGEMMGNLEYAGGYTFEQIHEYDGIYATADGSLTRDDPAAAPAIPGVWKEPRQAKGYRVGPLQLRKSRDERTKEKLDAVSGATISYANNRVDAKKTRSSEGAIIYPIIQLTNAGKKGPWTYSPSMGWKFARIVEPAKEDDSGKPTSNDPKKGEADEVRFDVGIEYAKLHPDGGTIRRTAWEISPYVITDSKFRGLIGGAQMEFTPYIQTDNFAVNMNYKGPITGTPFKYKLTFVPLLDFNRVYYESRFIDREDTDSHLGTGARSEVGVKTKGYPSLEFLVTYKFLQGLDDSERYSDLFTAALKLWLTENAGISIERQKGETPVAEKDVDLTTLGLEVKF